MDRDAEEEGGGGMNIGISCVAKRSFSLLSQHF